MTRTTTAVPSVWPCLTYRDGDAALHFLVDVFGFEERAVHADGDVVHHAELTWSAPDGAVVGGIMFGSARPDGTSPDLQPPGTACVHVVVADPDALHARAVAAGATVVRELEDTDYGSRLFAVRDPEGNLWSFGTWYE
jgi:uncharacterized glyoxalase superfamily protein PhnB